MASTSGDHSSANDNIDLAEGFKLQGNEAFKQKDFKSALNRYTRGIELLISDSASVGSNNNSSGSGDNPSSSKALLSTLYNNRAAVYLELKKYEEAITDARKSISTVDSAKGHLRLGSAYWRQNRLRLALDTYQNGLLKFPGDANLAENVQKLKKIIEDSYNRGPNYTPGGNTSVTPGEGGGIGGGRGIVGGDRKSAIVDLMLFILVFLQFLTLLFIPAMMLTAWKGLLALMATRCFLLLKSTNGVNRISELFNFKLLTTTFGGNFILLCLILFIFGVPPMPTIVAPIAIYTFIDLATTQRGQFYLDESGANNNNNNDNKLRIPLISTNPTISAKINSLFDKIAQNKEPLLCNAATMEIASPLFCLLGGGGFIVLFLMLQFVKLRYRYDNYYKLTFGYISGLLGKLFYHRRCPAVIGSAFTKLKDVLHNMAST